jgi:hypothetical protein
MRKYLIIGLIIVLFGCDKNETDTEGKAIWKPNPRALLKDSEVQLDWLDYSVYEKIMLPYEIVDPDKFEIYISRNDFPNFTKLTELDNDKKYSYTVSGLENNKPVYFYMTSMKKGFKKLVSDTIMVIPNKEIDPVDLAVQKNNHTILSVSKAHSLDKIAYVDKYYSWNRDENCCMAASVLITNSNGSQSELVDINAYEPCWSPDDTKIVFRTENNEVNLSSGIPSQIALFDYSSKSITKLTNDTVFNYAPVFSKNGKLVLYQSTKGVSDFHSTTIWLINLTTLEKTQLTNLGNYDLINFGRPNWIDNESYIFHATKQNTKNQIFKSRINSNTIEKVIGSQWNDFCPSISPNEKIIAFISDRSGSNQVWVYNFETKKYKQITGYTDDVNINEFWARIEWIDNQTITFTLNETRFIRQRIE